MDFYTNFMLRGNNLLLRGVKDGIRYQKKLDVCPTVYVPHASNTGFKSVYGHTLKPMQFGSPKEAKSFVKDMESGGQTMYGFPRFEYTEIDSMYPGQSVLFDFDLVNTLYLDIECESENGFPNPALAAEIVNAITCGFVRNGKKHFVAFGLEGIDISKMTIVPDEYVLCRTEHELLHQLMVWIKNFDPDIITGWNVDRFDMVYLHNRVERVIGEGKFKMISPWGNVRVEEVKTTFGKEHRVIIDGVTILDYLDLYKKFTYTMQESYKLGYIAYVELEENKLDYSEYGELYTLYKQNFTMYVDYNIKDVELVMRLEEKKKLLKLACIIAYSAKTNYGDVFMNTRLWDVIISNYLNVDNIQVPFTNERGDEDTAPYEGAYVKDPIRGKYDWISSFDLESLYPCLIMQYNISPETMVDPSLHFELAPKDFLDESDRYKVAIDFARENNYTLASNGSMYTKDKEGMLPALMNRYFTQRKVEKKKKLEYEMKVQAINEILMARGEL